VIKLVVKLAIVGLIANATWRVGGAYASHYRFVDAVRATTQYRGGKTDEQIHNRVFELASQYDVPASDATLTIRHEEYHTIVDGSYTRAIDVAPGFTYPWPFTIHVDTFSVEPPKSDGSPIR
jgi:hypothetical protein